MRRHHIFIYGGSGGPERALLPYSLLMCVTYPGLDPTGYEQLYSFIPQQVKFTLPGHIFTHLGFPECPYCLECNSYSRLCYDCVLMIYLINGRRTVISFLILYNIDMPVFVILSSKGIYSSHFHIQISMRIGTLTRQDGFCMYIIFTSVHVFSFINSITELLQQMQFLIS